MLLKTTKRERGRIVRETEKGRVVRERERNEKSYKDGEEGRNEVDPQEIILSLTGL